MASLRQTTTTIGDFIAMEPLFSIITVTFNAESTIVPTIESVACQKSDLFEWIVIDGASSDSTVDLVRRAGIPRTLIVSEPDRGLYDAMNKGLNRARGEYVIFLNAGDRFHSSDVIERLTREALDNDFPGIIYGQTDIVDAEGHKLAGRHLEAPAVLTFDSFRNGMVVCHQAFVALRKITGDFNLRYRFSADYEWCLRVLKRSRRNLYIDDVLIDYLAEGQTTANRRASLRERFSIMCDYFGTWDTIKRHLSFIPRYLRRQRIEKSFIK